jgi:DNA polymerase (family 10)
MTNTDIAKQLRERAGELARQGDNLYRIRAFRQAAFAVMGMDADVSRLVSAGGAKALEQVPGIGKSLSETIAKIALN